MSYVSNTISATFPIDYGNGRIAPAFVARGPGLAVMS
jgi:hypothetical protein